MQTLNLEEAQSRLREIVVALVDQGQPLATLVRTARTSWPCQAGSAKDKILWIAPDFDAPLDDFKEYME